MNLLKVPHHNPFRSIKHLAVSLNCLYGIARRSYDHEAGFRQVLSHYWTYVGTRGLSSILLLYDPDHVRTRTKGTFKFHMACDSCLRGAFFSFKPSQIERLVKSENSRRTDYWDGNPPEVRSVAIYWTESEPSRWQRCMRRA